MAPISIGSCSIESLLTQLGLKISEGKVKSESAGWISAKEADMLGTQKISEEFL